MTNNNMKNATGNLIEKMLSSVVILCLMTSLHPISAHAAEYTPEDVELLANIMWYEEGCYMNDPDGEYVLKLAGSVVIHRKNSDLYPNTIHDVVYQSGQYGSTKAFGTQEIPAIVYQWAEELLRNGPIGPSNLHFQAQFKQGSEVFYHYGNQYFCLR